MNGIAIKESLINVLSVIPANAGIQAFEKLDSRIRGNDE